MSRAGGATLRMMRETHGLTQQQLADLAGVSRSWLSRAENGKTPMHDAAATRRRTCSHCGRSDGQIDTDEMGRLLDTIATLPARRALTAA